MPCESGSPGDCHHFNSPRWAANGLPESSRTVGTLSALHSASPLPSMLLESCVQNPLASSLSHPGLLFQSQGQGGGQPWGSRTQRVSDFDLGPWATQGDGDLLQAGVKGDPPCVLAALLVVRGQQVHLGGLDG